MVNNKKLMAGMTKVGQAISRAEKSGKALSAAAVTECRQILREATKALFRIKVTNARTSKSVIAKRSALNKSVAESLIGRKEGRVEASTISKESISLKIQAKRIMSSIEAVKRLATQLVKVSGEKVVKKETSKMSDKQRTAMRTRIAERIKAKREKGAASPRNEQLDKGVDSSGGISSQPKVTVTAPQESTPQNVGVDNSGIGNEAELDHQKQMEGPKPSIKDRPTVSSRRRAAAQKRKAMIEGGNTKTLDQQKQMMSKPKVRAKKMYLQASKYITLAEAEKDATKKASLKRRATLLEKSADKILADAKKTSDKAPVKQVTKTRKPLSAAIKAKIVARRKAILASRKKKASEEVEATTVTFATNDQVLLSDGVVGSVSAINADKLTVSVAGVDKEVLADSVKKITSAVQDKAACGDAPASLKKEKKTMSIKDKIKAATDVMRTASKKKKADAEGIEEVPIAIAEDAPAETLEMAAESTGDTVAQTETKAVNYVDGLGWTVNKTDNEVVNFGEDKGAAESFVKTEAKRQAAVKQDDLIDSANVTKPESQEDTVKKLKGLDQSGKDYGTTTKDEKVNPQTSMIGKAGKETKATAQSPNLPVDSTTAKEPESHPDTQKTLKGLDQQSKGYSETSAEQKINPQLSVYARKQKILTETNKKQAQRLAVVEASLLVDRAVKVGAITEERRSDQQTVLAELYASSPSEFKAFGRLVATLEESSSSKKTVASRTVKKVKNSLENRESVVVDTFASTSEGSLENGTMFDD